MNRLTSNKEVSEMSMYELAHNSCYAKDGNARYRDYDTDIDARKLAIKLLDKYADIPNEFTCDEDFDDFMTDSLQYGTDSILGLIAVFYRNIWAMADLRETLKRFENLKEHGTIIELPCKAGDTFWTFTEVSSGVYDGDVVDIQVGKIEIRFNEGEPYFYIDNMEFGIDCFGKTIFQTREEAEKKIKEIMNNG